MLAVYRPAGIIQRLCVKLKRLATLQFPIAVIQRIAQRKALLFLAVQQPTLCIIEGAGGDTQPLAGQPLTAGVIDGAGVFAVSGPLYSQLPLRRDLAAAIIDILFDAQRRFCADCSTPLVLLSQSAASCASCWLCTLPCVLSKPLLMARQLPAAHPPCALEMACPGAFETAR